MTIGEKMEYEREEAREEGINIGKAEGINIGKAEGREEGLAEGINIGKKENQKAMLLKLTMNRWLISSDRIQIID
jgi:flagellar biosynthesis/type III secretory pathway protein FliH